MVQDLQKVTTEDGHVVEFGEKTKVKKQSYYNADQKAIVTKFIFRNGAVRQHLTPIGDEIIYKLAQHGADQKFGDEFAGLEDVEDCIGAFEAMSERLSQQVPVDQRWSEKRQSDGMAGTSLLARALVMTTGLSMDEVKVRLKDKDAKTKSALTRQPKIAEAINKIKAERDEKKPTNGVDPNKALTEFLAA